MKVRLWTRSPGKYDWKNEVREFARIPVSGECLALGPNSPWYLVQLVVHMPYPGDCDAEVYSMQVDRDEVKQRAFYPKT
jgi:hypothetical protein